MVQLQGILESIKIKQQAAQGVYAKRVRAAQENGDKEKIQALRTAKESVLKPKISEKEKEIQKMMKLGLSREKALTLLGFTDIQ